MQQIDSLDIPANQTCRRSVTGFPNFVELQMKDSTLMILGGVLLCFITILSVLINAPLAFSGLFCFGGAALVFAGLYELTVNFN
jgi:hypothetical protein